MSGEKDGVRSGERPVTDRVAEHRTVNRKIYREFAQRGRQILVYGPADSKRSNLVLDTLASLQRRLKVKILRVVITGDADIPAFMMAVAAQLNLNEASRQRLTDWSTGINEFLFLGEVLLRTNTILVVDSMENLSQHALPLRARLAEMAKNLSDDAINYPESYAKVVFIGGAATAEQLWTDVQSLRSRLATISVETICEIYQEP